VDHDAVQYYTDMLLGEGGWLGEELAWTFFRPRTGDLTATELARRVSKSDQPDLVERDFEEAYDAHAVVVEAAGDGFIVVDLGFIAHTPHPEFLAEISAGLEVWHLSWHVAYSWRLTYALDRRILACVPYLDTAEAYGEELSAVQAELDALAAARDAPWPTTEATALAIVEQHSGVRLDLDWFEQRHPSVVLAY
jgi:hypothetical protein